MLTASSHRRKAAAIRAFYRFSFAEGLIERDVAGLLDLPRAARQLPDTLDVAQVEALLEAPRRGERAGASATAPSSSCCTPAGLRVSEALGLDREDVSLDGGSCASSARATASGGCPSATSRSTRWRATSMTRARGRWLAPAARVAPRARRPAVRERARRAPGRHGRVAA